MSMSRVVAITGCDSGLGWALAALSAKNGFFTVAGMHGGTETDAAKALSRLKVHPVPLDVTNSESVFSFGNYVRSLLIDDRNLRLYGIVNNAGIMTIGDYECNTPSIIENTININLLGTMRVISEFLPDLRRTAKEGKVRPRVINVTSHCGLQPLPGFAAYCASKAGVLSLTKALRMEQQDYGVQVVAFIPGGFVTQSNIMSKQVETGQLMLENLDAEQKSVYEKKLSALFQYLSSPQVHVPYDAMKDENITAAFTKALLDDSPKQMYKVEPWRYKFYHTLFNLNLPERIHKFLVMKFLTFPSK